MYWGGNTLRVAQQRRVGGRSRLHDCTAGLRIARFDVEFVWYLEDRPRVQIREEDLGSREEQSEEHRGICIPMPEYWMTEVGRPRRLMRRSVSRMASLNVEKQPVVMDCSRVDYGKTDDETPRIRVQFRQGD